MFLKAMAAILAASVIGVFLLGMRQQRFVAMHEMTRLHQEMTKSRHEIWSVQSRIAYRTQPERLAAAVARADLSLDPAVPGWVAPEEREKLVKAMNKAQRSGSATLTSAGRSDD